MGKKYSNYGDKASKKTGMSMLDELQPRHEDGIDVLGSALAGAERQGHQCIRVGRRVQLGPAIKVAHFVQHHCQQVHMNRR